MIVNSINRVTARARGLLILLGRTAAAMTTSVMMAVLLVFGAVAYFNINIDLMPEVDFPVATVTAIYPGADPESVETKVVDKLEEGINQIAGIKTLKSTSMENVGLVVVQFELDLDPGGGRTGGIDQVGDQALDVALEVDSGQILRMIEFLVDEGHRADPPLHLLEDLPDGALPAPFRLDA